VNSGTVNSGAAAEVYPDPAALATAVAGRLLARISAAQTEGRIPSIALTGGGIAGRVHREIARQSAASPIDWTRVEVCWGDERFVAPGSADRNAGQARAAFLDAVGATRVHEMPSTADAANVAAGAAAYAKILRARGGEFDIVMLGVGPDGHIASLFPGSPQLGAGGIAVGVTGAPKPPPERISLTLPAINRAQSVWLVVSGPDKATAVAAALAGRGAHADDPPAARVSGRRETIWFLDRDAAGQAGLPGG
jgi:6-phosphogluconolactonase